MNNKEKQQKLYQAKEILESLGLPKAQYNNRSAWVLLALANIKPMDSWCKTESPMLPTVDKIGRAHV